MSEQTIINPKLLVSVRNAEEVAAALAGGADWIDLKEPMSGPLAAVDAAVADEAVDALDGKCALSAALGELCDWEASSARELLGVQGISVVKLGLSGCAMQGDWRQRWRTVAMAALAAGKQMAAVIYADWQQAVAPSPNIVLEWARSANSEYLLIDTYDKSSGSTLDHLTAFELENLLRDAKQAGMTTVVAGSLSLELLDQLPYAEIDMVAVRGAICRGERTAQVDAKLVAEFRHALRLRAVEI